MEHTNYAILAQERIPGDFVSAAAFHTVKTTAPCLLMVADRSDGLLDAFLLQRKQKDAFCGQIKLPMHPKKCIADGLASVWMQQLRQHQDGRKLLQVLYEIFQDSPEKHRVFEACQADLLNHRPTFRSIQACMMKLLETCEINFSCYAKWIQNRNSTDMIFRFFAYILMQWNQFLHLLADFLKACGFPEWHADLQVCFCGSVKQLCALAEPGYGTVKAIELFPSNREMLYQMAKTHLIKAGGAQQLFLHADNFAFEAATVEVYRKHQKSNRSTVAMCQRKVKIFSDQLVAIPADAGIYAGSKTGNKLPLQEPYVHAAENQTLLIAPFTRDFSELLAEQSVTLEEISWDSAGDAWQCKIVYMYQGKQYSPAPHVYEKSAIQSYSEFPTLVVYRRAGQRAFYVRAESETFRVDLHGGVVKNDEIVWQDKSGTMYLALCKTDGTFLGQVGFQLMRKG